MTTRKRFRAELALGLVLLASPADAKSFLQKTRPTGAKPPKGAQVVTFEKEAPFRVLDNVEGDDVDLLAYPIKPMVLAPDRPTLWAVNTHGSEVAGYTSFSGAPDRVYGVPWNPISIEYWVSPADGHHELLVVTRGTHGLTRLDPASGALLGYLELPAEPGGSLVSGNHLFVACSAEDLVVEIDLLSGRIFDTFDITTTRHLLFLSPDGLGNVLVTPLLSGNNTMPARSLVAGIHQSDPAGTVFEMSDPAVAQIGLPDEDVFRLIPGVQPNSGSVEVAARGVGTMLFAHGINPVSGKLWVLNTQSINAGPAWNSLSEARGLFSVNRLSVVSLPAPGAPAATQHAIVSLDDAPSEPVGKPFALSFAPNGYALIVGTLTDNVTVLSPSGAAIATWGLPQGSLPRGILYDDTRKLVLTYCWGTNTIEVRAVALPGLPVVALLDLGYDPTSPKRKEGRAIFYDGRRSLQRNLACESCHVEGLADNLVWNHSNTPIDDKGVMFTKSLKGIEFIGPYHWRGERGFADFNSDFSELLGGAQLSSEELDRLQRFVFGLQNPANPFEHPRRVVTDDRAITKFRFATHNGISATNGQDAYFAKPSFGTASCQGCHTLPTGTDNDFLPAGLLDTGHRNVFTCTAYNGLWRKEQKTRVTVKLQGQPAEERPPLGAGPSHAGLANGVFEFNVDPGFTLSLEDREDVAFFMHQIDQGLAPAVHRAALVSQATLGTSSVPFYLVEQARQRNCDIAVFGTVDLGGGPQQLRWAWDRDSKLFQPEDAGLPARDLLFFFQQARNGTGANLLVGLPVGLGRRFGIDADNDQLLQRNELALGTDPRVPDTDHDGYLDGTEVARGSDPNDPADQPSSSRSPVITSVREMFHTARVAKLLVETDVPTHVQVSYGSNRGDTGSFEETDEWKTLWEVALLDLEPSNELAGIQRIYNGTITVTDEFGNQAQAPLPAIETLPFIHALQTGVSNPLEVETVVRDLTLVSIVPVPNAYDLTFSATIEDRKLDAPAPLANQVAVVRVLVNGQVEDDLLVNGLAAATTIKTELSKNQLYGGFGGFGPFVVGTISGPNGRSFLRFSLPNAKAGDEVQLSLELVGEPKDNFDPQKPYFRRRSSFDLPNTQASCRVSEIVTLPSHKVRKLP